MKQAATGLAPARRTFSRSALAAVAAILAIEVLTGSGLTLLGSMLPELQRWWHVDDARTGTLLLALFSGSSLGALLVRASFRRSLIAGLLLMAASLATLNLANGRLLFVPLLTYGLGLGLAMTSNSMLIGARFARRRAAMLTLLNFSWSAGAAVCPFMAQWMLHRGGPATAFWAVACAALFSIVLTLQLIGRRGESESAAAATGSQGSTASVVIFFATFAMLYCGAEASIGSWVLTYVQRMGFRIAAAPSLATSCFWLALLLGRALAPAILLRVREERLLVVSLLGACAGVLALLSARPMAVVLLSASLAGFSLAPIFPICVSILMTLSRDAVQARWLFAIAGAGSAGLPWITGLAAQRSGSLHVGLLVPLSALGLMLLMLWLRWGGLRSPRGLWPSPGPDSAQEPLGTHPLASA